MSDEPSIYSRVAEELFHRARYGQESRRILFGVDAWIEVTMGATLHCPGGGVQRFMGLEASLDPAVPSSCFVIEP